MLVVGEPFLPQGAPGSWPAQGSVGPRAAGPRWGRGAYGIQRVCPSRLGHLGAAAGLPCGEAGLSIWGAGALRCRGGISSPPRGVCVLKSERPLQAESRPVSIESSPGNKLGGHISWELKQTQGALVRKHLSLMHQPGAKQNFTRAPVCWGQKLARWQLPGGASQMCSK